MCIVQTGYPRQKVIRETLKLFYRESKKWCDIQTAYLRYAMQRCCIKKLNCQLNENKRFQVEKSFAE